MQSIITVRGLHVFYGAIEAVKGVDIAVQKGEVVAVLGANGAGKSSLLNAIAGLVPVASGVVFLDDSDITRWPLERRARAGVRLVPEGRRIFSRLSVQANLVLGGYFLPRAELRDRIDEMLNLFPLLAARRRSYAGHLSGGEQQMLAIARCLISSPRVLLIDEPSAGLSPIAIKAVYGALQRYVAQSAATILLVEQNVHWALEIAARAYVLELGAVGLAGDARDLLQNPHVIRLYLGE